MPLSPDSLSPLSCSTFEFEYCHDRPLRALAYRYVPRERNPQDTSDRATCSLLICSGLALRSFIHRYPCCEALTTLLRERDLVAGH